MGAIYEARCTCGYESAELTAGCGFQRICWDLATCQPDSGELLGECARELVEEEYSVVEQALAAAFENESLLFAFLWLIPRSGIERPALVRC
jgi:hypothetical protein